MNKITIDIGMKIRNLRKSHCMTEKELANLLGISQQHMSRYENGKVNIHIDMIYKIKNIFGINIDYFFNDNV